MYAWWDNFEGQIQVIDNYLELCLFVIMQRDGVALQVKESHGDWMPVRSGKKENKWGAAGQNVTAIVGAGVLALPAVFKILSM